MLDITTDDALPDYTLPPWSQELKEKWISALRSGEYRQCRGVLHDGRGYCCLGILAIVCGAPSKPQMNQLGKYTAQTAYFDGKAWKYGTFGTALIGSAWSDELTYKNDSGESFDRIADKIEHIPV